MEHEGKKFPVRGGTGNPRLGAPDRPSHACNDNPPTGDPDELESNDDQVEELFPSSSSSSSLSSSPPQDFDVNPESQYMPILDNEDYHGPQNEDDDDADNDGDAKIAYEQDYVNEDFLQEDAGDPSTSLSRYEAGHHHDYDSSPVIFEAIKPNPRGPQCQYRQQSLVKTSSSSRVIRCPVCEKPMRTFYCAKCIQTGKFVTLDHDQRAENRFSQTTIEYNSSEKSAAWLQASSRAALADCSSPVVRRPANITEEEVLQIKLRALIRKTDALKSLYVEQQAKLEETKRALEQTRQQVEAEKRSHKSKESKIELIKRFIASRKASVKKREDAKAYCLDELKQHSSRRVYQLNHEVFPLDEVNPFEQHNSSFVNMETSPLLTFSDGSHHQIELLTAYSIVEPWLPSNGDYSAYSLWVNDNKDQLQAPVDECSPERSPAYRIGAALAYTTQFVRNLANYLDVILPVQMNLDMFSRELLDDAQFSYNVAKLNANVIHLCVSQGIDLSLLNGHRTLKNLSLLFNLNLCDLGRKPIVDLENVDEVAKRIEAQLANDLSLAREDFYDFSKFALEDGYEDENYDARNDDFNENYHHHAHQQHGRGGGASGAGGAGGAGDDEDDGASDSDWEISDNISSPVELQMVEQSRIQQSSYISRPLKLFSSFWAASRN